MKLKKAFALSLALILAFAFTTSSFATTSTKDFDGRAYYHFNTTKTITKASSQIWSKFRCHITSVTYWFSGFNSCKAQPFSQDGHALSGIKEVVNGGTETYVPNPNIDSYNVARFRIYNNDNLTNNTTDNEMHAVGTFMATYS